MPATLTVNLFAQMLKPLRPALLRYAGRRAPHDDAEDDVADTVRIALTILDRFDADTGPSGLLHWMLRILDNVQRQALAERLHRREDLMPPDEALEVEHCSEDEWAADRVALRDRLEATPLTDLQRHCLALWMDGWTQREIAAQLGNTHQAVSYACRSAIARLQTFDPDADLESAEIRFSQDSHRTVYHKPISTGARLRRQRERRLR